MKRHHPSRRRQTFLALALIVWGAAACDSRCPADGGETAPTLASLSALLDDERLEGRDRVRAEMERLALPLAILEIRDRRFPATVVYLCDEAAPDDRWRCQPDVAGYADDTIHATEFPPYAVATLEPSVPVRLVGPTGSPAPGLLRAGAGAPGAMHAGGYGDVTTIRMSPDGTLAGLASAPGEQLLFALFRDPSGLVRKHVWVVRVLPPAW